MVSYCHLVDIVQVILIHQMIVQNLVVLLLDLMLHVGHQLLSNYFVLIVLRYYGGVVVPVFYFVHLVQLGMYYFLILLNLFQQVHLAALHLAQCYELSIPRARISFVGTLAIRMIYYWRSWVVLLT